MFKPLLVKEGQVPGPTADDWSRRNSVMLSDSLSSGVLLGLFIYLNLTVFCVDAVVSSLVVLWDFCVRTFMFLVLFLRLFFLLFLCYLNIII